MFIESPRFPDDISLGVSGGPEFMTDLAFNPGGFSIANATRDMPLHKYDAAHGVRTHAQFLILKRLFMNTRGKWAGFRFKDWSDFKFDFTTGTLVAVSAGVYQIVNQYVYGDQVFIRPIKKPVVGTIALRSGEDPIAAGITPGAYAIDHTTGLVTMVPLASSQIVQIMLGGNGATTVISLSPALGPVDRLTLSGLQGADAAVLNDRTFNVIEQSGAACTLAVFTAGMAITLDGSSTASSYAANDGYTAAGEFDLPVRFDTDFMQASMDYSKRLHTWGQIPLVELRNPG